MNKIVQQATELLELLADSADDIQFGDDHQIVVDKLKELSQQTSELDRKEKTLSDEPSQNEMGPYYEKLTDLANDAYTLMKGTKSLRENLINEAAAEEADKGSRMGFGDDEYDEIVGKSFFAIENMNREAIISNTLQFHEGIQKALLALEKQ